MSGEGLPGGLEPRLLLYVGLGGGALQEGSLARGQQPASGRQSSLRQRGEEDWEESAACRWSSVLSCPFATAGGVPEGSGRAGTGCEPLTIRELARGGGAHQLAGVSEPALGAEASPAMVSPHGDPPAGEGQAGGALQPAEEALPPPVGVWAP